jgi:hypothetical protein
MRPKFFFGYIIMALCFINMVVMRGVNGSFSVYYLADSMIAESLEGS